MKPQLPDSICAVLPDDVLNHIYKFVPHLPKEKKKEPRSLNSSVSPNAERDLRLIQRSKLRGMDAMYMRGLEDFILY